MAKVKSANNTIYDLIIMYYEECAGKWRTFLYHPNVCMYILKFKEQFVHNPFLQVIIFVVVASLLTPILLFVVFAIISAVFAFIGFIMIQVTVLAIGASILSCILFCIASTFIMIGLCIIFSSLFIYYIFYYTNHVFNLLTYERT
ncbi:uncharacterized protein LOC126848360 [Cataglyphis hispanica]|uniref:uncharacterized protein LOC126848360 n=1 Tax=Cataglyphis hispanica TaxID=1086592 RepID=UPI00217F2CCA|nr:uncharacterized protein LOC126848360 [Cataglyphis hispanica]XP_050445150.1 uncharacterized protein LOC126848360 [Cataglyphis hispanica]XP_050445151.1 uncharacterized protein LOC126848360 [Cataglyphis hispanica]